MTIKYGDFKLVGRHKGCGGRVMECSLHEVGGETYPPGEKITRWQWCNKAEWNMENQRFDRCAVSTRNPKTPYIKLIKE